jgi:hypothetical protein
MDPLQPSETSNWVPSPQCTPTPLNPGNDLDALGQENALLRAQLAAIQQREKDRILAENQALQAQIRQINIQNQPIVATNAIPSNTPNTVAPLNTTISTANTTPTEVSNAVVSSSSKFSFDKYDLPPLKSYNSKEDALADINYWALPKGWAFTIDRSKPKKSGRLKITIACDRRDPPIPLALRKAKGEGHNKKSKGTGCRFSLTLIQSLDQTSWELRYREPWKDLKTIETRNFCEHNHPPSSGTGSEHAVHRQIKGERHDLLVSKHNSGSKPRVILSELDKKYKDDLATAQDIWNAVRKLRAERKQGKNCTQALVDELEERGWISRPLYHEDQPDRLLSMFFAHPRSIEYLRLYCKVLIIDCTYNTNSAEMPLFEVIGIEATGKSFCVCFEFLPGETEDDLVQALTHLKEMLGDDTPGVILSDKAEAQRNAIKRVFPLWTNLFCIWHANRSVNEKCKTHFTSAEDFEEFMKGWAKIVSSPTLEVYQNSVKEFKQR